MVAGQNGGPVVEVPANSNTGPRIRDYLAPALRRVAGGPDVPLHLTVANWCVAIQCAAARACAKPGEVIPHSYRVSGIELEQDAQEKYTDGSSWWVPIEAAQSGAWKVQVGALALLERDDPKVRGDEWQRHLVRVSKAGPGSRILTLGGNEGNTFDADPSGVRRRILGFVAYPDAMGTRPRFG